MAFVQDVPTPNVSTAAPVAPGDSSDVIRLGGVEDALKFAGRALSGFNDTARKVQADEVTADAVGGINDLLEERESAAGIERQVSGQIAQIGADGEITDEERTALEGIQVSRDFLQQARDTGVLSQQGFSTRLNALRRASVARAENLGIQTNIEQLFLQNQSLAKAPPVVDPTTKFITENMDALHGKGNWSTATAAEFVSSERKAQTLLTDLTTDAAQYSFTMTNHMNKVMQKMMTDQQNGIIFTEQDNANIALAANDQASGFLKALEEKRSALNNTGRLTSARSEQINAAAQSVMDVRDTYTKMLTDPKSLPNYFSFQQAATRATKGLELYNQLNMPPQLRAIEALTGANGGNNGIPGSVFIDLLDADSNRSNRIATLLAEQEGLGRSPDEFRKTMGQAIDQWLKGVSNEELVAKGIMLPELNRVLTMEVQRTPAQTTEEVEFKIGQQSGSLGPVPNDAGANTANMAAASQDFEQIFSESKRHNQTAEFTRSTKDMLRRHASELTGFVGAKTAFVLGVSPTGQVVVNFRPEAAANLDVLSPSDQRVSDSLRAQLQVFGDYAGKAINSGMMTVDDLSDMITPDRSLVDPRTGETIDAFTGAGATEQAAINRLTPRFAPDTNFPEVPENLRLQGVTEQVDSDIQAAIQLESSGDAGAINPGSGAAGLLQLTPERAKEEGIDPSDPNASIQVFKEHRDEVAPKLTKAGLAADGLNTYILWQQGNRGGLDILQNQDKKLSDLSSSRRSNMLDNPPPTAGWQAIENKNEASVSQWVDGWRERFTEAGGQQQQPQQQAITGTQVDLPDGVYEFEGREVIVVNGAVVREL